MYPIKTPAFIKKYFADVRCTYPKGERAIYLTFDDGPTPEVTEWVLDLLGTYQAKATFFCIGHKVSLYTDIYQKIQTAGHAIGNHSYSHFNGWKTYTPNYIRDVENAGHYVDSDLFRPPYGRLKWGQYRALRKSYQIIFWDVLSGDFDANISEEQCLENVLKHTEDGSIIVFHDYQPSFEKLQYVLPRLLEHYTKEAYQFKAIK